ncbi:hypothetical protein JCM10908_000776 [Rhodotorula pacifica]|uniref:uncharacterized protein n=1 Tax=Rhodotorula pacifica TaxID=1495444 RepID=UPI003173EF4E
MSRYIPTARSASSDLQKLYDVMTQYQQHYQYGHIVVSRLETLHLDECSQSFIRYLRKALEGTFPGKKYSWRSDTHPENLMTLIDEQLTAKGVSRYGQHFLQDNNAARLSKQRLQSALQRGGRLPGQKEVIWAGFRKEWLGPNLRYDRVRGNSSQSAWCATDRFKVAAALEQLVAALEHASPDVVTQCNIYISSNYPDEHGEVDDYDHDMNRSQEMLPRYHGHY